MNLGMPELIIILIIALLLFGGSRLPVVARSMGEAIKEFKKAMSGDADSKEEKSPVKKTKKKKK